jgi:hypothetical protein
VKDHWIQPVTFQLPQLSEAPYAALCQRPGCHCDLCSPYPFRSVFRYEWGTGKLVELPFQVAISEQVKR